ncbi:MAG: hypothetical protein QM651_19440, partial [Rhodoblastus sp.]
DGNLGAAVLTASINSDGTVLRGEGVTPATTQRFSTGTYTVGFVRDITNCVYTISPGEGGVGSAVPFMAAITRRSGNPNGVFIQIRNSSNANVDNPFFVIVACGR